MALSELHRPEVAAGAHGARGAHPVVTLRTERWEVDVLPGTGGALAAGRIRTDDGVWRDLLRRTSAAGVTDPERCASFPMLPWSNRIDDGVLPFAGQTWQLQRNGADGTAIHGALRYAPWRLVSQEPDEVTLAADAAELVGVNFPWRFAAQVRYALHGRSLEVATRLTNADVEPFPAGFGHHPYFARTLLPVGARPPVPPARLDGPTLQVGATRGYPLRSGTASGPAGEIAPRADFRTARAVGTAQVDDVLTGRTPGPLAALTYDQPAVTVRLEADEAYSHVVLYAPRGRGYLAVEPVTHVNGGFALHAAAVPGTGIRVLGPGESLAACFSVTFEG